MSDDSSVDVNVKVDSKAKEFSKVFSLKTEKGRQVSTSMSVASVGVSEKVDPFSVFKSSKVTVDQNVHELGVADGNLGMKTEVNDPLAMSMFEVLGKRAIAKGYSRTATVYGDLVSAVKTNMVSFRRGGRKEMVNILTAQRQAELENPKLEGNEKVLGSKGGRR